MTLMQKSYILSLQLNIGKHAKGKSRYITDAIMLPTINCDITKAATNVTVIVIDFKPYSKKWRKYPVTLKNCFKISYYKIQLLSKIFIVLQDTVTSKGNYLITRNCY